MVQCGDMITFSSLISPSNSAEPLEMDGKNAIDTIAWMIGLASTIYLCTNALYLVFLALVFGSPLAATNTLGYVAFVGKNAIPVIFYLSFGVAGMKALSSRQFRRL